MASSTFSGMPSVAAKTGTQRNQTKGDIDKCAFNAGDAIENLIQSPVPPGDKESAITRLRRVGGCSRCVVKPRRQHDVQ
jgi:hypothetical protein